MIRLLTLGLLLFFITEIGEAQGSSGVDQGRIADFIGLVSQDSLRTTIARLQQFGSRHWSLENRRDIAAWIGWKMHQAGLEDVTLDSFQFSGTWQYNVVGTLVGSNDPDSVIVLGGHTDSYSTPFECAPGADDNASGTAAVLEAARVFSLAGYRPNATFRFVGFAAEESGLRGSSNDAGRLRGAGRNVRAMLNFDMIAHRDSSSLLRIFSLIWYNNARWLAELDSLMARTYTSLVPVLDTVVRARSDSYAFWANGYPAVFHYERGRNPIYHTALDVLDSLDLAYAQDIVKTALATALTIDGSIGRDSLPSNVPQAFTLLQNFPNPFNPGTRIRYEVPEPRFVTIAVYDVLGRLVTTLVNEWKDPGSYDVPFNGKGLASGVYVYRLEVPPNFLARKMVLMQ